MLNPGIITDQKLQSQSKLKSEPNRFVQNLPNHQTFNLQRQINRPIIPVGNSKGQYSAGMESCIAVFIKMVGIQSSVCYTIQ